MFSYLDASKWVAVCTTASLGVGLATVLVPRAAIAFDSRLAENVTVQINGYSEPDDGFPGGSGVIVGREGDRYWVLTALHVVCDRIPMREPITCRQDVAENRRYRIRTASGQEYEMRDVQALQQRSNDPDLALVQFESSREYSLATLGDSDQAQLGSSIYVAGFPAAFQTAGADRDFYLSQGPVVSRRRQGIQGYTLIYGASTKIGMSGGPVFDSDNRVVGIHGIADTDLSGQSETGEGAQVKSGFNGGIPIASFMELRQSQQVQVPNLNQDNAPPSQAPANIANPQTAQDYQISGTIEAYEGNLHSAQERFNQALAMDPNLEGLGRLHVQQGNLYFAQGDYQGAIAEFTAAIEAEDESGMAYTNRAVAQIQLRDYAAAIEDLTAAIANGDYDARTHYNRGVAHARRGNLQAAQQDYTRAIQLDSNFAAPFNARANLALDEGNLEAALQDYERAIAANPNFADAYNNRGVIYNQYAIAAYEQGDVSEAISQMERAIADLDRARELFLETGRSMQHQEVMFNLQNLQNNLQTLQRQQRRPTPTPQQTRPPAPQPTPQPTPQPDNPGFMF
ncbi:tetratricopeptide repeat protein [Phormidium yuhuli AB48]|uniref:Tetratricopeptide repeat protein n=1 Tax=Phormidium yuhuli AB48 TaxID=2940671 RepID=A0ABY5AM08_9CYAN|nr:serine protease [Phormidium yuhuli]USR89289.1 tetratricopeptide repeat protein [Phormidium yuhuli AB48]